MIGSYARCTRGNAWGDGMGLGPAFAPTLRAELLALQLRTKRTQGVFDDDGKVAVRNLMR